MGEYGFVSDPKVGELSSERLGGPGAMSVGLKTAILGGLIVLGDFLGLPSWEISALWKDEPPRTFDFTGVIVSGSSGRISTVLTGREILDIRMTFDRLWPFLLGLEPFALPCVARVLDASCGCH